MYLYEYRMSFCIITVTTHMPLSNNIWWKTISFYWLDGLRSRRWSDVPIPWHMHHRRQYYIKTSERLLINFMIMYFVARSPYYYCRIQYCWNWLCETERTIWINKTHWKWSALGLLTLNDMKDLCDDEHTLKSQWK